jgi:hypothetical protein
MQSSLESSLIFVFMFWQMTFGIPGLLSYWHTGVHASSLGMPHCITGQVNTTEGRSGVFKKFSQTQHFCNSYVWV